MRLRAVIRGAPRTLFKVEVFGEHRMCGSSCLGSWIGTSSHALSREQELMRRFAQVQARHRLVRQELQPRSASDLQWLLPACGEEGSSGGVQDARRRVRLSFVIFVARY